MHSIMRRTAALALAATIPFGLTACGGGDKPSKDEVKAGYSKATQKRLDSMGGGGSAEAKKAADTLTNCVVDAVYDKVDAKTLNALKDGDENAEVSSEDKKTVTDASQACAKKA